MQRSTVEFVFGKKYISARLRANATPRVSETVGISEYL